MTPLHSELNRMTTLHELLAARDQRVTSQKVLIERYSLPVISLTITIPGGIKLTPCSLYLFTQACKQIEDYYQQNNIECLYVQKNLSATGPEGFFVINQSEEQLKKTCMMIEDTHPLGRLWDIDVISAHNQQSISRSHFGHTPRKCIICDENAKICARSRAHSTDDLIKKITSIATQCGYIPDEACH